jgi:hypothetical protein
MEPATPGRVDKQRLRSRGPKCKRGEQKLAAVFQEKAAFGKVAGIRREYELGVTSNQQGTNRGEGGRSNE